MTYLALAVANVVRSPLRTALRVLILAAAVALLGAMLLFIGRSLQTMTSSATRSVPLDWQAPSSSYNASVRAATGVARQPGVLEAVPVATSSFAGAEHTKPGVGTIRSAAGSILAVPPHYLDRLKTFHFLRGGLRPGEIVFDQQLAATLQVEPGDSVKLTPRRGVRPQIYRVSGIALVTAPDVLFQPLNPLLGPAPAQPPADIAILPLRTFARKLAPKLPAVATSSTPGIPGAQGGTQWQVQAQVDPRTLRGSPAHAYAKANQLRNSVERSLPGQVQFVDNLSDSLNSAAGDALYAETLYIMLALPGALIALGLAYLAALGTVERDRRELSLLRARGASRRGLAGLALIESAFVGVVAGLLGAALAVGALFTVGTEHVPLTAWRLGVTAAVCVVLASAGAAAARLAAVSSVLRESVVAGRRAALRPGRPLWQRLYVDLIALAVSGLVYWLTVRTGFSAVVNPDSNPTLSLSVYMFLAPALLWIGASLLLVRLRGRLLTAVALRAAGDRPSTLAGFVLSSASRRAAAINRGLLVVGLLLAFGVNLGIFTATYNQQAKIDAQLTLGADVVATAPAGAVDRQHLQSRIARIPGVTGTTTIDHAYAYVGPDLQDTFGIDPATLTRGTSLRNSYFLGGTASALIDRLRHTPDGVLVSRETITDYSLAIGDLLKLRVLDRRTGRLRIVPFHVAGVVQEFPSAPRDSFMVANQDYLLKATHEPGPNVVFAKTSGDPAAVARRVAAEVKRSGATVRDIEHQTAQTVSSITTVDLTGITRIEEAFAILLAAAAMGLFVGLAVAERRHEFATMAALGASLRSIAAFVWSEAAIVLGAALALAALLGWLLAEMLVAMLQHVFDPPPDHLAAPWVFLLELAGAAVLGAVVAGLGAAQRLRRLPLGAILREQ